jgi:uncharacterized RDD family membrane protein YckC
MISQPMQNPPGPPQGPGYPPAPPAMGPPPAAMQPYPPAFAGNRTYAGFWIRFLARILDSFIVGLPLVIILGLIAIVTGGLVAGSGSSSQNANNAAAAGVSILFALFYLVAIVISIGYWVYFWGTTGQTLGMRILKLQVVDANTGAPIGIGRALVRWLMTLVNSWACYIGWIWVAFDARKQGWHDKVANSIVLQG